MRPFEILDRRKKPVGSQPEKELPSGPIRHFVRVRQVIGWKSPTDLIPVDQDTGRAIFQPLIFAGSQVTMPGKT